MRPASRSWFWQFKEAVVYVVLLLLLHCCWGSGTVTGGWCRSHQLVAALVLAWSRDCGGIMLEGPGWWSFMGCWCDA